MEATSNSKNTMTPELAKQLMDLLDQNIDNAQVIQPTLNTIVQYTYDQHSKLLFNQPRFYENIKLILSFPTYAPLNKICLTLLVHFSGCQELQKHIIKNNIQDIIMKIRSGIFEGLNEELSMLILLNVSRNSYFSEFTLGVQVQQHPKIQQMAQQHPMVGKQMMISNNQEPKQQPQKPKQLAKPEIPNYSSFLLTIIYSFLQSKPNRAWVISNIFVNVSSYQHGRRYVAQQKLHLGFLQYMHHPKDALRLGVLRIFRNVAFLWDQENVAEQMLKAENQIINNLAAHILLMLLMGYAYVGTQPEKITSVLTQNYQNTIGDQKNIDEKIKLLKDSYKNKGGEVVQKSVMNQIQICVDILVILSNTNWPQRKPEFSMNGLKQIISILKFVKSQEFSEGSRDKLQALQTFCLW